MKRWFTLIEVLIVIVIIWILAWSLVPRVWSAKDSANDSVRITYAHGIGTAIIQYRLDHQEYPIINDSVKIWNCDCATLHDWLWNELINYWYSIEALPTDPVSDSSFEFCWETITWWQFLYCKMRDSILFVSHVERNWWNAMMADFQDPESITQNMSFWEISNKIWIEWWDLYFYHWS